MYLYYTCSVNLSNLTTYQVWYVMIVLSWKPIPPIRICFIFSYLASFDRTMTQPCEDFVLFSHFSNVLLTVSLFLCAKRMLQLVSLCEKFYHKFIIYSLFDIIKIYYFFFVEFEKMETCMYHPVVLTWSLDYL